MFANLRTTAVALVCALTLLAGTASAAFAQPNNQTGLINVNLEDVLVQAPVSVAVPIGVALNACGINILALQEGDNNCTATNNSFALSRAVADAALGMDGGNGGGANNQTGLVNVNITDLTLQIPVSVALPIGIAANVCGVNVASGQLADNECDAENTSEAMSNALARAIFEQNQ